MIRNQSGTSAVELLIASLITSIISLAFLAVLLNNYKTNAKVTNMSETMSAIRNVKERIGKDVREGRSLGDVYGDQVVLDATDNPPLTGVRGYDGFPSPRDPVYGNSTPGSVQWPNTWGARPYKLDNTTLIVQIPVGDDHNDNGTTHAWDNTKKGWPTQILAGQGNPAPLTPQDNVETHVYKIVPDTNNPGEWKMQYASFPGFTVAGYSQTAHNMGAKDGNAQTILTGIIGPIDTATGQPKIFQFVDRTDKSGTPRDLIPTPDVTANYTGVVVNLEVRKHDSSVLGRKGMSLQPIGMKMEVFLRNNALATSSGQPLATVNGG